MNGLVVFYCSHMLSYSVRLLRRQLHESRLMALLLESKLSSLLSDSTSKEQGLEMKLANFKQKTKIARRELEDAKKLMESLNLELADLQQADQEKHLELCKNQTQIQVLSDQLDHCLREQKTGSKELYFCTKKLVNSIKEEKVRVKILELENSRLKRHCEAFSDCLAAERAKTEAQQLRIIELESDKTREQLQNCKSSWLQINPLRQC